MLAAVRRLGVLALDSQLSTLNSLPPQSGIKEIVVRCPNVVAHRVTNVGQVFVKSQTARAISNIRSAPTGARVVRVVRPLMSVHEFMRHERLICHPSLANERRHGPRRHIHLRRRAIVRAGLGVVVVKQILLLLVTDVPLAVPAGLLPSESRGGTNGDCQYSEPNGANTKRC